ncbi:unnamed protein product [Caenorhabditis sp. 36 PRJEB53466]|nr:unnamed protein product [Caenorhabditis sp. 36 PRJEB53466]
MSSEDVIPPGPKGLAKMKAEVVVGQIRSLIRILESVANKVSVGNRLEPDQQSMVDDIISMTLDFQEKVVARTNNYISNNHGKLAADPSKKIPSEKPLFPVKRMKIQSKQASPFNFSVRPVEETEQKIIETAANFLAKEVKIEPEDIAEEAEAPNLVPSAHRPIHAKNRYFRMTEEPVEVADDGKDVEDQWEQLENDFMDVLEDDDEKEPTGARNITCNMLGKRRKPSNRRCALCNRLRNPEDVKNVTIDTERLIVALGAVHRKRISTREARLLLHYPTKTYICRIHFGDACDAIFDMMNVQSLNEIVECKPDLFTDILSLVTQIRGVSSSAFQLKRLLICFMEKYCDNNDVAPRKPEKADRLIAPKTLRAPRKQILESDQYDSTVKLVEQETFKLPTAQLDGHSQYLEQPETCRFCLLRDERSRMSKIAKSGDNMARWAHKLGPDFAARLNPDGDNFICRTHFPDASFNRRGRLRKGMFPKVEQETVVVTYQIKGTDFLKVEEAKTGTDREASVDLECSDSPGTSGNRDFEDEVKMTQEFIDITHR